MLENACAGLFLDPGLGKTSITLAALKILKREKLAGKVLIVAPLRVCYSVWPKEAEKWKDFAAYKILLLHGKDKEKNLVKEADIYLINPEGLSWLFARNFKALGFDVLVIDESSKFKATNTQRFKLLRPILPYFRRRYILTGTPAPNGLMDVFGQIFILDLGAALGRFITHYRNTYFYPSGFGGYEWRLQEGAEQRIQEKLKPLTMRLEARDYLELPELIINQIDVELPSAARDVYNEMERDLFTALEKGEVVADNAAAASTKCRQMANGGVYGDGRVIHNLHMEKAEAVKDLIEELQGTPALIAYDFEHDLQRLLKALGKDTPHIGGGVSPKRAAEIERAWNAGELPVLLGHPASVAHGLNLQNAGNHIIWHSLTWNFENYDQFNQRVLRQGSRHKKVFVHHIVCRDTIDEAILMSLRSKDKTQKSLLNGLKEYLRKKS
jgi:SNF2 family DNA or RNA helicase